MNPCFLKKGSKRNQAISIALLALVLIAWPKASANTPADSAVTIEPDGQKTYSSAASLGLRRSTAHENEADFISQAFFHGRISASIYNQVNGFAGIRANHDLINERYSRIAESYAGAETRVCEINKLTCNLSLTLFLPFHKEERKYDRFRGAAQLRPSVRYKIDEGTLKGLTLSASSAIGRRVYKYQSNEGGSPLRKETLSFGLSASYETPLGLSFSASFLNTYARDFNGEPFRNNYASDQSVAYKIDDNWSLTVGHATGGYTFDNTGSRYDVSLYDRYNSLVYSAVTLTY